MHGVTGYMPIACWGKLSSQPPQDSEASGKHLDKFHVEITFLYGHWIYFLIVIKLYTSGVVQMHFQQVLVSYKS